MPFFALSHIPHLSGAATACGAILWGIGSIVGRLFPGGIAATIRARSIGRATDKAVEMASVDPGTAVAMLRILHGRDTAPTDQASVGDSQDQPSDPPDGSPP